ncbi:hypothetical protein [Curtobacterium flaccumfaciens]|uniref:hypothetical protein n=1 Tax=Curtobacterium flaccumfaciens TaxID=2035 RepID=UPI001BDFBCA8|nr:hypothetical protein [Curtobacterium flaccumfaciens]MBT1583224.1 hypothetical protein [Curtobacterium flaccumfaciens pv. flaccumfaciens]MCX2800039.1 hypothetical protein [Curtobacterium flaccumfaciens pv. flaccumfaciens]
MRKLGQQARRVAAGFAAVAVGGTVFLGAIPAHAQGDPDSQGVVGGWSESTGTVDGAEPRMSVFAVNHRGAAEKKTISGTTHKRSHGWITWAGVQHYTRARLEHGSSIIADSGRKWGKSGTEAVTTWKPYRPNRPGNGVGSAKTYYGR